jgi:tRNA/tmRNA/rRNA uracil-C5-methylase (TrmA/RlmC/RlmD family)
MNKSQKYGQATAKRRVERVLRIIPEGWDVPPDSFFQNNLFLLPKLVETARESLRQSGRVT